MKGRNIIVAAGLALAVLCSSFATADVLRARASEAAAVEVQTADKKFAGNDYLPYYALPADTFEYECNDAASADSLRYAFDGDFSTQWTSQTSNGNKNDPTAFVNTVTVTFHTPQTLGGVLYQASDARVAHGYPQELEIRLTDAENQTVSQSYTSTPTAARVVFALPQTSVKALEFVYIQPNTSHNWVATAKEIEFLLPQNDGLDLIGSGALFGDYTQTTLKQGVDAQIAQLRAELQDLPTYPAIEQTLARAESVAAGQIGKIPAREFATGGGANLLTRYGSVRDYCSKTLKMSTFGVDYQPTGVAAAAGETLTVYVEAKEDDPLPKLMFTQTFNIWERWNAQVTLSRGRNVIPVPNLMEGNEEKYTVQPEGGLTAGGAVYLLNGYTAAQQSDKVKVYIEGGVDYPLYRKGGDEAAFLAAIERYCRNMEESPSRYPDVAELVSDHVLASSLATSARTLFLENHCSPAASAAGWDNYLEELFAFGGVSVKPSDPHYNEIHAHLRHNCRIAQPWAGALAYAAGGFCGFCAGSYGDPFSLLNYHTFGWGVSHELGHAFDNNMGANGRTITEVTNNMWSFYDHVYLRRDAWDRPALSAIQTELAPDIEPTSAHFEQHYGSGYVFWWQIESVYPGFWGAMENEYRFRDVDADMTAAGISADDKKLLTQEERHAYLCSVAAKTDLGYYFDRWGFYFSKPENAFRLNQTSDAYRALMEYGAEQGMFPRERRKFWYADFANYNYVRGGGTGMYDGTSSVSIRELRTTAEGTLIILPEQTNAAHLGYEILEHNNVIGFTASQAFTDTTEYAKNYKPTYTVRAYDRLLNASAVSAEKSPAAYAGSPVARVGEKTYSTLSAAISAAAEGDTVTLIADAATGAVVVDKSLTIACEGNVTLSRGAAGNLITLGKGVQLTIDGGDGLAIDGGAFTQAGALVYTGERSTFTARGVQFCNNHTTGDGGAINASAQGVNLYFERCVFESNRAARGGAIANLAGNVIRTFTDCTVRYNEATEGGGLYLDGAANVTGGSFLGNTAERGGAIYVAASNGARKLQVSAGENGATRFKTNTATQGGALYVSPGPSVASEIAKVAAASFVANRAEEGSVLYVVSGQAALPASPEKTDDFTFEGWLVNGTAQTKEAYVAGDKVDCAGKASFYVSFGDEPPRLVEEGTLVTLPDAPQAEKGMRFAGWKIGNTVYGAGETVQVTEDILLSPVFEPVETPQRGLSPLVLSVIIAGAGLVIVAVVFAVVYAQGKRREKGGTPREKKGTRKS